MDIEEIFKYIGEMYVQSKAEIASLRAEIVRLQGIIDEQSRVSPIQGNER